MNLQENIVLKRNVCLLALLMVINFSCNSNSVSSCICVHDVNALKHYDVYGEHHGKDVYYDFDQARECAQQQDRPMLVIFGGWGVRRFLEFSEVVMKNERIDKACKEHFLLVYLYVDDRRNIPEDQIYRSTFSGRLVKKVGVVHSELQIELLRSGSQPEVAIINHNKEVLSIWDYDDLELDSFEEWLRSNGVKDL